jgi:hypothetical protein
MVIRSQTYVWCPEAFLAPNLRQKVVAEIIATSIRGHSFCLRIINDHLELATRHNYYFHSFLE